MGLTVLFEFGFGHYVAKQTWSSLLADDRPPPRPAWPLALSVIGTAPVLISAARRAVGPESQ